MAAAGDISAINNYVTTKDINFDAPNSVRTKTYHGISLVINGNVLGRVQSWQPQMFSRAGKHIYELNGATFGRCVDYVPAINQSYSVTCNRMELWNNEFEIALGYPTVWADLIDQDAPFTINEFLYRGSKLYRHWQYLGCWFSERNENGFDAETQDGVVIANSTIQFVTRVLST